MIFRLISWCQLYIYRREENSFEIIPPSKEVGGSSLAQRLSEHAVTTVTEDMSSIYLAASYIVVTQSNIIYQVNKIK
jgi:hypothetical protein